MRSAYTILAWICLCTFITCSAANNCICSNHNERPVYKCDNTNTISFTSLYYDGMDSHCLVEVSGLHAKRGWKAGLFVDKDSGYQRLVYIEADSNVVQQACTKSRLPGHVETEPGCYPQDNLMLNPTTSTSTTSTTTTTTTTTTPTPTTPSTTPTTPSTTPKTTLGTVPTVKPSTVCTSGDIMDHLLFKTSASHPSARHCPQSNTNSNSEALLLAHCKPRNTHWQRWTADLKVVDHCTTLAQGDPIGVYINGRIAVGVFAAFWRCKTTSASFEIVYQSCGAPAKVVDVKNSQFTPDAFYTLKW